MKAIVQRPILIAAMAKMAGVVDRRNTIPILSNVLIEAEPGGSLRMMATDLDLQIVETVACQVETAGATTVSAHTFFDIARKMPEGSQVALSAADGPMTVIAGRAGFNLATLPRDDFPVIAAEELPHGFDLAAAALRDAIAATRFATAAPGEPRYYLTGIFVHAADDALKFAATDGHRLAHIAMALPADAAAMPDIIVPRKCVETIARLLDDRDGTVAISLSQSKIRFDLGDTVLTSKLIDGTFPDYTRVIPQANGNLLRIDRQALGAAADRVATIASEKTRVLKWALGKNCLTLSCTSPEHGTSSEEVPCDYDGAAFEIGFNARYLIEVLAAIGPGSGSAASGAAIEIHLGDATSPTLLRAHDKADAIYVLMPMRV